MEETNSSSLCSNQKMPYIKLLSSLHKRPRHPPRTQHSMPIKCNSHRIYELNDQRIKSIEDSITTSKAIHVPI